MKKGGVTERLHLGSSVDAITMRLTREVFVCIRPFGILTANEEALSFAALC
jgi:hypothetical protein